MSRCSQGKAGCGKRTVLGMLIGVSGIAVLVLPQGFDFKNANLLGSFGILIGACSWASGAIYSRVAKLPRSPLITGGLQLLFGGVLLDSREFHVGRVVCFYLFAGRNSVVVRIGVPRPVWLDYYLLCVYMAPDRHKCNTNFHAHFYQSCYCGDCRVGIWRRSINKGNAGCRGAHCHFSLSRSLPESSYRERCSRRSNRGGNSGGAVRDWSSV